MPERIQRKRTKGWRKPSGVVNVARPSKYGNPYRVGIEGTAKQCVAYFERDLRVKLFTDPVYRAQFYADLRGRDLMCFCDLTSPCHADVLLKYANLPEGQLYP